MPSPFRRAAVPALAAGAALAVLGWAPPAQAAGPDAVIPSGNWSGYAADHGTYTSVSASWTQPAISCTAQTSYFSTWVGLDGMDNPAAEQAGTEQECSGGTGSYYVWWEVLPSAQSPLSVPLHAGDKLTASVTANSGGTFTMKVSDATQGWSKSVTHAGSPGFQNSSAEIVAESAALGSVTVPGTGQVSFSGATVNGGTLAAAAPDQLLGTGATVSPITGGGNFSVTYGGAGLLSRP